MNKKKESFFVKTHYCKICEKTIVGSAYKYKAHLYQHKIVEPRFECSFCFKKYFRRDIYEKHFAVHTGQRKFFTCDHCDRSFIDKRNLINHLKIHDEYFFDQAKSQYKCIACGVTYCEERLLKYHIRKHHFNLKENEPKYLNKMVNDTWIEPVKESQICVEMTKVNNNIINIRKSPVSIKFLNNEEQEASKFKQYMDSVFASKDQTQYSKAVCGYCNKEMLKKSLKSHIRERHLKLKKFECEVCKKRYARHYQLVAHPCGNVRRRRKVKLETEEVK